jgi:hypothetical protein
LLNFNKNTILFAFCLILTISFWNIFNVKQYAKKGYTGYDVSGYYLYLPAIFIYKDISAFKWYDSITIKYQITGNEARKYGLILQPTTNRYTNIYPMGVAIMQLPFFLIADGYSIMFDPVHRDGFYHPYQFAILLSSLFYCLLGFWFLRKFLGKYFSDGIITICILLLFFGTNLFHYTIVDAGMSHVYSFCLIAVFLFCCQQYFLFPSFKKMFGFAFVFGLLCITRYTNCIIILLPILWQGLQIFKIDFYKIHLQFLFFAIVVFFVTCLPQLFYWHYTSGHFFVDTYGPYHFDFMHPRIWKGLFSFRKGLFIYTPMALFGFIGLIPLYKHKALRFIILPYLLFFVISFFIAFSWFLWFYGGSFGCRVFIESYAIMSAPICAFLYWITQQNHVTKSVFTLLFSCFIMLNLFQSWQYKRGIIHWASMDYTYYWQVFGKTSINESDRKFLNEKQANED